MYNGMKFTINTYHLIIILIAILCIVYYPHFFGEPVSNGTAYIIENTSKPIDPDIPADLPHNKYIVLKEKTQHVRDIKNGDWYHGSGTQFGYIIGTDEALICDTCTVANTKLEAVGKKQYYITLPGWLLKQDANHDWYIDSTRFYVEKEQSYVRKPVVDRAKKTGRDWYYKTHFMNTPVKFRYNREKNCVMIPVTKLTKQICSYIIFGLGVLFVVCWFALIIEFVKFVISLSKGLAFTEINITRLLIIALGLIAIPVMDFLLTLIMRLIFSSYLTNDVKLNAAVYSNSWQTLCGGIVFLMLFKAFKQGKALKEENELTV
ncbi:hypothetical protein GCM10028826_20980 [Mucilaginibacter boryungensis]